MKRDLRTIIKEEINRIVLLKEFMQPSFSWEEFNSIMSEQGMKGVIKYCREHLGEPIGDGSSRIVFEIDDHTVLKLSLSKDDVMQNLRECNIYSKLKDNPLLPKIYGHADDYAWLWCERVIPCSQEDFEKILGIPYNLRYSDSENDWSNYDSYHSHENFQTQTKDENNLDEQLDFMQFMNWLKDTYIEEDSWTAYEWSNAENQIFKSWLKHPWFQYLLELIEQQNIDEFFDDNFGIALRHGKPTLVVLDIGWGN